MRKMTLLLNKRQYIQTHPYLVNPSSKVCSTKKIPNQPSWYHLIKDHLSQGSPREALVIYLKLRREGECIYGVVPLVLKACTSIALLDYGKVLHAQCVKTGVDCNVYIGTSLVGLYGKCGVIDDSRKVFNHMPERNVVTWNAMVGGYLRNGDMKSALCLFKKMDTRTAVTWIEMIDGFAKCGDIVTARDLFDRVPLELKNVVTWTVMVDGYTNNGDMEAAKSIFEKMPEKNFFVWSSMISGYFKNGSFEEGRAIFERIPIRNLVNWNALISGYTQNGLCEEALEAFGQMRAEGFKPDEVTIASVLSACAQVGLLDTGKEIHQLINKNGIKLNQFVLNGLVDMYGKCGDLANARLIFDRMSLRNNACWNSMISSYAINGQCKVALEFFERMENLNEKPNEITFLSILSACAHGGFVNEGLEIFFKMEKYGMTASIKHYGCLVDLLGRAGRLAEAYDLIKRMPVKPNEAVWGALFGGCRIYQDTCTLVRMMEEVNILDCSTNTIYDSHFVILSNILAASDKWKDAEKMRMTMVNKGFQKTPGCSFVMLSDAEQQLPSTTSHVRKEY